MRTDKDREEVIYELWKKGIHDIYDLARACSNEPAFSDFNPGATVIFITHHLAYKRLTATVRPPDQKLTAQLSVGR